MNKTGTVWIEQILSASGVTHSLKTAAVENVQELLCLLLTKPQHAGSHQLKPAPNKESKYAHHTVIRGQYMYPAQLYFQTLPMTLRGRAKLM